VGRLEPPLSKTKTSNRICLTFKEYSLPFQKSSKNHFILQKELDMENSQAIQIGTKTVNLSNITYIECIDTDRDTEKSLTVYFTSGHKMSLFKGDPTVCKELYSKVNTALNALDLSNITKR